jgi:hypothetical protein
MADLFDSTVTVVFAWAFGSPPSAVHHIVVGRRLIRSMTAKALSDG